MRALLAAVRGDELREVEPAADGCVDVDAVAWSWAGMGWFGVSRRQHQQGAGGGGERQASMHSVQQQRRARFAARLSPFLPHDRRLLLTVLPNATGGYETHAALRLASWGGCCVQCGRWRIKGLVSGGRPHILSPSFSMTATPQRACSS